MTKTLTLEQLNKKYDALQEKYGSQELNSIYNGGCKNNPDICFVFMNPTGRNIASAKDWTGIRSPWVGTKNVWDLFIELDMIDKNIYKKIKSIKGSEWTPAFAKEVYADIEKRKIYITNLAKCTQTDARVLNDKVFKEYLPLFEEEIKLVNPKIIILFGNQVSSIFLNTKISVSQSRKKEYQKQIGSTIYKCYSVFYPVGNGRFNIDKSIEDIKYIVENNKVAA